MFLTAYNSSIESLLTVQPNSPSPFCLHSTCSAILLFPVGIRIRLASWTAPSDDFLPGYLKWMPPGDSLCWFLVLSWSWLSFDHAPFSIVFMVLVVVHFWIFPLRFVLCVVPGYINQLSFWLCHPSAALLPPIRDYSGDHDLGFLHILSQRLMCNCRNQHER